VKRLQDKNQISFKIITEKLIKEQMFNHRLSNSLKHYFTRVCAKKILPSILNKEKMFFTLVFVKEKGVFYPGFVLKKIVFYPNLCKRKQ
jgi:hypothetical protein